jgi:hypothetical protein
VLGLIDAFLSRKQKACCSLCLENGADLAFRELAKLANVPTGLGIRATFKADLSRDPIRKDPRFDQLAAQLPQYP